MKCPIDNSDLLMSDRNGVEIDYCPKCRGVWLDRGELDKIIERNNQEFDTARQSNPEYREEKYYKEEPNYRDDDYYKRRKKKSFLGDMFDFD